MNNEAVGPNTGVLTIRTGLLSRVLERFYTKVFKQSVHSVLFFLLVQYLKELKVNLWDHIGIIVPQKGLKVTYSTTKFWFLTDFVRTREPKNWTSQRAQYPLVKDI